jgi:hypothetical protein
MRVNRHSVYLYRALFGLGFIVLGTVVARNVALSQAPGNKLPGFLFSVVLIALGAVRIVQYVQARRRPPA